MAGLFQDYQITLEYVKYLFQPAIADWRENPYMEVMYEFLNDIHRNLIRSDEGVTLTLVDIFKTLTGFSFRPIEDSPKIFVVFDGIEGLPTISVCTSIFVVTMKDTITIKGIKEDLRIIFFNGINGFHRV